MSDEELAVMKPVALSWVPDPAHGEITEEERRIAVEAMMRPTRVFFDPSLFPADAPIIVEDR